MKNHSPVTMARRRHTRLWRAADVAFIACAAVGCGCWLLFPVHNHAGACVAGVCLSLVGVTGYGWTSDQPQR